MGTKRAVILESTHHWVHIFPYSSSPAQERGLCVHLLQSKPGTLPMFWHGRFPCLPYRTCPLVVFKAASHFFRLGLLLLFPCCMFSGVSLVPPVEFLLFLSRPWSLEHGIQRWRESPMTCPCTEAFTKLWGWHTSLWGSQRTRSSDILRGPPLGDQCWHHFIHQLTYGLLRRGGIFADLKGEARRMVGLGWGEEERGGRVSTDPCVTQMLACSFQEISP